MAAVRWDSGHGRPLGRRPPASAGSRAPFCGGHRRRRRLVAAVLVGPVAEAGVEPGGVPPVVVGRRLAARRPVVARIAGGGEAGLVAVVIARLMAAAPGRALLVGAVPVGPLGEAPVVLRRRLRRAVVVRAVRLGGGEAGVEAVAVPVGVTGFGPRRCAALAVPLGAPGEPGVVPVGVPPVVGPVRARSVGPVPAAALGVGVALLVAVVVPPGVLRHLAAPGSGTEAGVIAVPVAVPVQVD